MKRGFLVLAPLALAAIVFAQGTEDALALVKQLGSEDYAVREEAQKKLIEMGEKALPALEEALKSEDLEVRLRAGRALRAIRGEAKQQAEEPAAPNGPTAPGHGNQVRQYGMSIQPGKVSVTITQMVDGKLETKTYEAASLEELQEKYPELKGQLGGRFQFRLGARDDFDMDKFWEQWNNSFDNFDDDIRKWQEETRREVEGMRRWLELQRNQAGRLQSRQGLALPGPMLGVRAGKPSEVLDAQLDLRGRGLVIDAIEKDTLADRLGLERFDVLVELNGREIRGVDDVAAALHDAKEGESASAKVVRHAQTVVLNEAGRAAPK